MRASRSLWYMPGAMWASRPTVTWFLRSLYPHRAARSKMMKINEKTCDWLMDNADAPIRYRVLRELLKDENAARKMEGELLDHPAVMLWLNNLKPQSPPQHWSMEHGSFDFCLENAILKIKQLGLHGGFQQVADAVSFYIDKIESEAGALKGVVRANSGFHLGTPNLGFNGILIANLLTAADVSISAIEGRMLNGLNEMYDFVKKGSYDIYVDEEGMKKLKSIPSIWKDRKFIKRQLTDEFGFCYPLIYDLVGMHKLYRLNDPQVNAKVDAVIDYVTTDELHDVVPDGYGIFISGDTRYHSMGWDPKYPGWHGIREYVEGGGAPKLLFFAQNIVNYPASSKTRWFGELTDYLDSFKDDNGLYKFPAGWLKEQRGYAVEGGHMSFGENRKKKNWREIESTFYMQSLFGVYANTHMTKL